MRSSFLSFSAALALAIFVNSSAYGVPTVYEDFTTDTDGYWAGSGNRGAASANNYGWSDSDNTGNAVAAPSGGATGGGELGGFLQRGPSSGDYGFPTGNLDPLVDVLHADGVYTHVSGSGNMYVGFYNQATHGSGGGDPRNMIGIQFDDGTGVLVHLARDDNNQREHGGPAHIAANTTIKWSIDYDPVAETGDFVVDGTAYQVPEGAGYFGDGVGPTIFDRFGIWSVDVADSVGESYWDDITFSSNNPIPEPSAVILLLCGALALVGARRGPV
jgi:hypothetical protein